MVEAAETPVPVFTESHSSIPAWTLGAVGLAAGLMALIAVLTGSPSWMLLGCAVVVWATCGWAIYFRPRPRQHLVAALGSLLLASAALAALAVLSGLYLLALGPSWIL